MAIVRESKEVDVVMYLKEQLAPYFDIREEVWGVHMTGRRKRIDLIITPSVDTISKGFPDIPVGIEVKTNLLSDGNKKQIVELYHQAITYRHSRFEIGTGFEFLPLILIYPPIENYLKEQPEEFTKGVVYILSRLSGKYFIGDLFVKRDLTSNYNMRIRLCGADYYKIHPVYGHRRLNMNWGFERYEEEKKKLQNKNINPIEYEKEIYKLCELLGI
jgi:hypothetical protein